VSFANDLRAEGVSAFEAALRAGTTRLRPVVMTTLAMIAGMLPMALGVEEGGEQNAALARSAIGGLTGATFATLFLVPMAYTALRRRAPRRVVDPELDEAVTARRRQPVMPPLVPVR
jgi:multidrug efflux pump subunit AcrB